MNEMVGEYINQEYFDNISDLLLKCYEHLDIDEIHPITHQTEIVLCGGNFFC